MLGVKLVEKVCGGLAQTPRVWRAVFSSMNPGELADVPEKIWWLPSGGLDMTSIFWEGLFVVCYR